MGYVISEKSIKDAEKILNVLVVTESKLEIPTKYPTTLAYAIHTALKSVQELRLPQYMKYEIIKSKFRIRVKGDKVIFEPRSLITYENPLVELVDSFKCLEVPKVTQVLEIVGACIKHKAPQLSFPNAKLDDIQLHKLKKWTDSNGYVFDADTIPLTLTKNGAANSGTKDSLSQQG